MSRSKKIKLYLQGNKSEVSKKLCGPGIATADDEKKSLSMIFPINWLRKFWTYGFSVKLKTVNCPWIGVSQPKMHIRSIKKTCKFKVNHKR